MLEREHRRKRIFHLGWLWIPIAASTVASCADNRLPRLEPPMAIKRSSGVQSTTLLAEDQNKRTALSSASGIAPPVGRTLAEPFSSSEPPRLTGENISVNFEAIPLPAFVNTVFGELLKVNFEIDSAVTKRDQLVTLNTTEAIPPDQFYRLVSEVLISYGLQVIYQGNINSYRIIEAATARQDVPQIVRSRALSSVPGDQRPIFYFAPIHNVQSSFMMGWLELALRDRVRFSPVGNSNGLLLMGRREDINAALETLEILDQPAMAGARSLKISPAYWSASKMADQLTAVLTAEGYSTGIGAANTVAVRFIPIEALNTIIVFSTSETTLQHVLKWASDLDQPGQTVNTMGMYYYQVRNASATKVADLVSRILGQGPIDVANPQSQSQAGSTQMTQAGVGQAAQQPSQMTAQPGVRQKVIVDESRNAIIFQGTAEEYAQFRGLLEQMDRAPLEVMIEATVAEVTLDETESIGMVLGFDDGLANAPNRNTVRSATGLFATLLRSNGQISGSINALTTNSKVTVLSTPRLVTTSGQAASIQVGTQVPIITTQQTAASGVVGGTSNILQDVQYRDTGVMLSIKPLINSNRVELTIAQEVSSAAINNISDVDSPIIQRRSIQTTLSLSDGETALLGGLITENFNTGDSGVPFLKDIPLVGNLFKNQSRNSTRTELIILLTPYIVDGPEASRAVRDAFRAKLGEWAQGDLNKPVINNAADAQAQ
jgi:general secretion pathway protein D